MMSNTTSGVRRSQGFETPSDKSTNSGVSTILDTFNLDFTEFPTPLSRQPLTSPSLNSLESMPPFGSPPPLLAKLMSPPPTTPFAPIQQKFIFQSPTNLTVVVEDKENASVLYPPEATGYEEPEVTHEEEEEVKNDHPLTKTTNLHQVMDQAKKDLQNAGFPGLVGEIFQPVRDTVLEPVLSETEKVLCFAEAHIPIGDVTAFALQNVFGAIKAGYGMVPHK